MQAIILAAGESSRFYPFNTSHKSTLKIMGKPLIEHTLTAVKESGIKDVVIVAGKGNNFEEYFKKLDNLGLKIHYLFQEEATGMGDALLLARKYIKDDFFLLHAHRIDFLEYKELLENKKKEKNDIVLLAKKVEDKTSFHKIGLLKVDNDKVLGIVEKPLPGKEPSNLAVVGIYFLNRDFLNTLQDIPREHYSFEKAISAYASKKNVKFIISDIDCVSLKYPWDILRLKNHLLSGIKRHIVDSATISSSAQILGNVYVDNDAKIMENAVIKGPCYIGKNVTIGNSAILRDGADIEENVVIGANMEIKNSLVMADSKTHSGYLGDSIIGRDCRIAAGFHSANVRLDRATVKAIVKDKKVDTGLKRLGVMVGNNTRIGVKSSTMPGVIIGRNVVVGSNTTVMDNVEDDTKYYTKFQEVVIKK